MQKTSGVGQSSQMPTRTLPGGVYLVLLCVWLIGTQAAHAVMMPMDLNSLATQADTVILGTVTRQVSAWDAHYTTIHTDITVAVERAILGTPGAEVTCRVMGGIVGSMGMRTSNDAVFHDGERVILFLDTTTVPSRIVGMQQGKITVQGNTVTYDGRPMAVDDLITAIRTAAR